MQQETIKMEEKRKQPSRLEVIGAVLTVYVAPKAAKILFTLYNTLFVLIILI